MLNFSQWYSLLFFPFILKPIILPVRPTHTVVVTNSRCVDGFWCNIVQPDKHKFSHLENNSGINHFSFCPCFQFRLIQLQSWGRLSTNSIRHTLCDMNLNVYSPVLYSDTPVMAAGVVHCLLPFPFAQCFHSCLDEIWHINNCTPTYLLLRM